MTSAFFKDILQENEVETTKQNTEKGGENPGGLRPTTSEFHFNVLNRARLQMNS
jgi:hypothetical protein